MTKQESKEEDVRAKKERSVEKVLGYDGSGTVNASGPYPASRWTTDLRLLRGKVSLGELRRKSKQHIMRSLLRIPGQNDPDIPVPELENGLRTGALGREEEHEKHSTDAELAEVK